MASINIFNKSIYVMLILLFAPMVLGFETGFSSGTILNGDVSHNFGKSIVKVSPERAVSISSFFEQRLLITNTYGSDLYYFINPYYDVGSVSNAEIYLTSYQDVQEATYTDECVIGVNDTQVCTPKLSYITIKQPSYTLMSKETKTWGSMSHYHTTNGVLIKNGETKEFLIKYRVNTPLGKWNARIWANPTNDWESIVGETAVFDYTIDPAWSMGTTGVVSAYKWDNDANDSTGSWNLSNWAGSFNATGIDNQAGNFNGGQYGDTSTDWVNTGNVSVSLWAYCGASGTIMDMVSTMDGSTNGWQIGLNRNSGGGSQANQISVWLKHGTAIYLSTTQTVCDKAWHNIGFSFNTSDSKVRTYFDGSLINTSAALASPNINGGAGDIGRRANFHDNYVYGVLDEIYIFSRLLEDFEFNSLYNGGAGFFYPFSIPTNYTISYSPNWSSPLYETNNYDFKINFTMGDNASVDTVSLNFSGTTYNMSLNANGSCGANCSYKEYIYPQLRIPLVQINNTNATINITFVSRYDNGTNYTNTTTTYYTPQYWAYYPVSVLNDLNVIEGNYISFTSNITSLGNITDVNLNVFGTWNNTNVTGVHVSNTSTQLMYNHTLLLGLIGSLNLTINITPYVNVSFNGLSYIRNTSIIGTQMLYQIYLSNCSAVTNVKAINYSVYDEDTLSLITTSSVLGNYTVYDTNSSFARNISVVGYSNSSHAVCIYPYFADYNLSRSLTYSAPGYITRTQTVSAFSISNSTLNITLYLGNVSSVGNIIITLLDQNNQYLPNYTVEAYLYDTGTGNYTLLDQGITNYEGKTVFQLNTVQGYYYSFRMYYPNGTLAYYTSPPFKLYSSTYIFQLVVGTEIQFNNLINIYSLETNLVYDSTSKTFNFTWNDTSNVSSQYCIEVKKINVSFSTINYNCSTYKNYNLTYTITETNGTFLAIGYIKLYSDGKTYPVAYQYAYLKNDVFGKEGILISFLYFILTIMAGVYNPAYGLMLGVMGLGIGFTLGMSSLGYGSIITFLICVLILIVRVKK